MVSNSRVTLSIMLFDKVGDAEDKNEFSTYQKSKIESDVGSVEVWKSGAAESIIDFFRPRVESLTVY